MSKTTDIRFRKLYEHGCIACHLKIWTFRETQMHHIKGHKRHDLTIPLCPWHHQGHPVNDLSASDSTDWLGPSLALNKKEFIREFGTELELLDRINSRIK